eukprot:6203314-Pleurochrysis_carterae.AAC.2
MAPFAGAPTRVLLNGAKMAPHEIEEPLPMPTGAKIEVGPPHTEASARGRGSARGKRGGRATRTPCAVGMASCAAHQCAAIRFRQSEATDFSTVGNHIRSPQRLKTKC